MSAASSRAGIQPKGGFRPDAGVLLVAAGATLWGTDTVLRQPLTQSLSSAAIVLYEHVILAVVALPALLATRSAWSKLTARQWAAVAGLAWGGSALATVCFTMAVQSGNPTTAVLLQKVQPVFTFLLAGVVLRERPRRTDWMLLAIAAGGAYLTSFGGSGLWPRLRPMDLTSALLALTAAALWGASTVLGRYVSAAVSFTAVTALRIVVALPLLALLNLPAGPAWPQEPQWIKLMWLALAPGLAALLLYYRGLRQTPAPMAAIAELCFPATTALLNWLFLGARLTLWQAAGFLLIWGVVARLSSRNGVK
jgi:drug/metabolite transporter (DMT)-like permease